MKQQILWLYLLVGRQNQTPGVSGRDRDRVASFLPQWHNNSSVGLLYKQNCSVHEKIHKPAPSHSMLETYSRDHGPVLGPARVNGEKW